MDVDYEIDAMRMAYFALALVSPNGQRRALTWLASRFDANHRQGCEAAVAVARIARDVRRLTGYRARRLRQAA